MVDARVDVEFGQALIGEFGPAFTPALERRKRTRHLIELGGLVIKAGIVDLTSDDRATIFGALLWMADKLQSDQGERARALWAAKGKRAFEADPATHKETDRTDPAVRR